MKRLLIVSLLALAACSTGVNAKNESAYDKATADQIDRYRGDTPVDGWAAFHGWSQP